MKEWEKLSHISLRRTTNHDFSDLYFLYPSYDYLHVVSGGGWGR